MKFVCDRCQTKYSIADEKVRGKVLKVRCKTCQNVITVREAGAKPSVGSLQPVRTSQRPSSAPIATLGDSLGESHEEMSDRTNVAPAPAGLMADLLGQQGRRPTPPPPPPVGDGIEWFLAVEGAQQGPFSRRLLVDRLLALPKDADVHVWNDKMDGWKAPKDVPEVADDLGARKPPAPPRPPVPRITPSPPLPPTSPRRGTMPLSSGVGAKLNLPSPHIAAAHAVPAPLAAHAEAAGQPTPPPVAAAAAGMSASLPVASSLAPSAAPRTKKKTNGVGHHAAKPAAPLAAGESDALSALNIDVSPAVAPVPAIPAVAPRLMQVSEATSWSGAGRVEEGRHGNTKMIFGFLAVVCVIIVVVALTMFNKKAPPVVTATAPVKAGIDSEALGRLHELAAAEKKNELPAGESAHEEPAAAETAHGKGPRGRGAPHGRQPVARGGAPVAAGAAPGTSPAGATPATPAGTAAPKPDGFRERTVLPAASVANRPAPSQADITRVIANNKIGIKTCYQRALLRDSSLTHGKIVVGVTIGISGRVKGVRVDGPSSFRTLEPCIREMVGRWTFPQSYEEYGTEFSYLFQGNE